MILHLKMYLSGTIFFNDELLTMVNQGTFVQLNKELLKDLLLPFENKKMVFENFGTGPGNPIKGFGQVLYKGGYKFYILNRRKLIKELAVQNRYDEFYQEQSHFIYSRMESSTVSPVKKTCLNVLSDKEAQLQEFFTGK